MHCKQCRAPAQRWTVRKGQGTATKMGAHYHLSVQMISRGDGRSAVACAAYRSGQRLEDERYSKTHNYAPRKGVTQVGILAPDDAPDWATDRQALWNKAEAVERRKDAQVAREFTLALPWQLDADQRVALVEEFVAQELIPRGMVVDYAIHSPNGKGDERNWHAHLMTTLRPLDGEEFASKKDREACSKEMVVKWREAWAAIQNRTFERLGVIGEDGELLRADHRSYEAQGVGLEPTVHMGVLATAMEREGKPTEVGDLNRAIVAANEGRPMRRRAQGMGAGDFMSQLSQTRDLRDEFQKALETVRQRSVDERGFDL